MSLSVGNLKPKTPNGTGPANHHFIYPQILQMSDTVFVAFASQKGGSGKSTLTALAASYLYYLDGVDVLVMDCDPRQHTQKDYRDNDKRVTKENPAINKTFTKFYTKFNKRPYKIIYSTPGAAVDDAEEYVRQNPEIKVVLFDITGTINDLEIVNLISSMHYLLVPISPDTGDLKSSLRFAVNVKERMIDSGDTSIKDMKLVWNRVPGRQKTKICELIDNYLSEFQLSSLKTVMTYATKYFKDGVIAGASPTIFRSTLLPPDRRLLKGSNLPELIKEIREVIKV